MAERRPIISGNWKMNHNHFEAIQTIQKLSYELTAEDLTSVEVTVHPPFTDLRSVQTVLDADRINIGLGAQHCHYEDSGAFTGEVSPAMLAKLRVRYVIAGHSERRHLFGETDDDVRRKVAAIFRHDMLPILCVGETLDQHEADETEAVVVGQLRAALADVGGEQLATLVVAYEPVWAIGTGRTPTPDDAQGVCELIRTTVRELGGEAAAAELRVQYGGSVTGANIAGFLAQRDIDGALVGGASLDADRFTLIVQYRLADDA